MESPDSKELAAHFLGGAKRFYAADCLETAPVFLMEQVAGEAYQNELISLCLRGCPKDKFLSSCLTLALHEASAETKTRAFERFGSAIFTPLAAVAESGPTHYVRRIAVSGLISFCLSRHSEELPDLITTVLQSLIKYEPEPYLRSEVIALSSLLRNQDFAREYAAILQEGPRRLAAGESNRRRVISSCLRALRGFPEHYMSVAIMMDSSCAIHRREAASCLREILPYWPPCAVTDVVRKLKGLYRTEPHSLVRAEIGRCLTSLNIGDVED